MLFDRSQRSWLHCEVMTSFLIGALLLGGGYLLWGCLTEQSVAPDPGRSTPAVLCADGVDFVVMPTWRIYLVQLLNIAGLGPVFGPIMGALWGPQVFLWVVFGAILGGAVHDFLSGAMSIRNGGAGLPELIGHYLGQVSRHLATFFILMLVVLVGTVFVKGPALLIVQLVPADAVGSLLGPTATEVLSSQLAGQPVWLWTVMVFIFLYYVIATLLPIDVIIGRIYPALALALLVMVVGLSAAIIGGRITVPHFTLANLHPAAVPAWPIIFITVSCGAVSGFHATQSPLMARCLGSERHMRVVFYGAMIAEGFIALVWASVAQGFYGGSSALAQVLNAGGPGQVVHEICTTTMGHLGGFLAILGVVVLPITSGDTAFRVGRLIVADYIRLPQNRARNRYLIALPLFAISIALNFINFSVIWRYFGWANQTLAAVTLWTGAVFLARRCSRWWLAAVPATFMTVVTTSYILVEKVGLNLPLGVGVKLGLAIGAAALAAFLIVRPRLQPETDDQGLQGRPSETEKAGDTLAC
jgi:carbon starvation protein CstA